MQKRCAKMSSRVGNSEIFNKLILILLFFVFLTLQLSFPCLINKCNHIFSCCHIAQEWMLSTKDVFSKCSPN